MSKGIAFCISTVALALVVLVQARENENVNFRPIVPGQPPFPVWPMQFAANYDVLVPAYVCIASLCNLKGKDFKYKGIIYYDYEIKRARAYYDDWCIPLFGDSKLAGLPGQQGMYNHTCSFLMTDKGTFFISPSFPYEPNRCCYFGDIPPPTPDWVKNTQWNGTATLRGSECNVWWFPGTDNPDDPYYGYWSKIDSDNTPVRFLGLSSIGPTLLDYTTFKKGPVPRSLLEIPENCSNECVTPPDRK